MFHYLDLYTLTEIVKKKGSSNTPVAKPGPEEIVKRKGSFHIPDIPFENPDGRCATNTIFFMMTAVLYAYERTLTEKESGELQKEIGKTKYGRLLLDTLNKTKRRESYSTVFKCLQNSLTDDTKNSQYIFFMLESNLYLRNIFTMVLNIQSESLNGDFKTNTYLKSHLGIYLKSVEEIKSFFKNLDLSLAFVERIHRNTISIIDIKSQENIQYPKFLTIMLKDGTNLSQCNFQYTIKGHKDDRKYEFVTAYLSNTSHAISFSYYPTDEKKGTFVLIDNEFMYKYDANITDNYTIPYFDAVNNEINYQGIYYNQEYNFIKEIEDDYKNYIEPFIFNSLEGEKLEFHIKKRTWEQYADFNVKLLIYKLV
jgi:hypothetical protein